MWGSGVTHTHVCIARGHRQQCPGLLPCLQTEGTALHPGPHTQSRASPQSGQATVPSSCQFTRARERAALAGPPAPPVGLAAASKASTHGSHSHRTCTSRALLLEAILVAMNRRTVPSCTPAGCVCVWGGGRQAAHGAWYLKGGEGHGRVCDVRVHVGWACWLCTSPNGQPWRCLGPPRDSHHAPPTQRCTGNRTRLRTEARGLPQERSVGGEEEGEEEGEVSVDGSKHRPRHIRPAGVTRPTEAHTRDLPLTRPVLWAP